MRLNIFGGITKRTELKTLKKLNGILNLYLRRTKMIKIENVEIFGWQAAIRGMRNPLNSWEKSDSFESEIGDNDCSLMEKLAVAGSDHRKFMRMINVTMDITAPLYWWKEFDTYKVGTVFISCITMHTITK